MPKFKVTDQNTGKSYEITAPDQAAAMDAFKQFNGGFAKPPEGAVPGSREYADWAAQQARAGAKLPQISSTQPSPPKGLLDKVEAATTGAINGVPFIGDKLLKGAQSLKANIHNTTPEAIAADDAAKQQANPGATLLGAIAGPTAALGPFGMTAVGARALGLSGSIASRIGFGLGSGAVISGGDALARGASLPEAGLDAAIGGTVGAALPAVTKGLGILVRGATGRSIPKQATNLARALRDDQIPVKDIPQRLQQMGPDAMVMDLGPNLQSQAGAIASVPGKGQKIVRDAIGQRTARGAQRVEDDVAQTLGKRPDMADFREDVISRQKAAADPLYERVRDVTVPITHDIDFVLGTPLGRQAYNDALRLAENDGYKPRIELPRGHTTVGLLDYTKRALDDIARPAFKEGKNNAGRQASNLAKRLTAATDQMVPEYAHARDAFAGPAAVLDASEAGLEIFTRDTSPREVQMALNSLSTSEQEAFHQGVVAAVERQLGNAVNEPLALRNLLKKDWNEQKLALVLGKDKAADLMKRIDREVTYGQSANVVAGNSETARRTAAQAEVDPTIGRAAQPKQTLVGLAFDGVNMLRNALSGVRQPAINEGMASLHTTNARKLSDATIRQLQRAERADRNGVLPPAGAAVGTDREFRRYTSPRKLKALKAQRPLMLGSGG